MPMIWKCGFAVAVLLGLVLPAPCASAEKQGTYRGWTQCSACHSDISASWQSSRHAKAIESLKKTGQESLPACVKCHVTGYERDGGFIDYELTPEMAGVQCEACHGPGSEHAAAPTEKSMAKNPGAELCRQCHTERQDPGFNYEKKVKEVHRKQP